MIDDLSGLLLLFGVALMSAGIALAWSCRGDVHLDGGGHGS